MGGHVNRIPFYEALSGFSEINVVWGQPKDHSQGLLGGFCSNPGKHGGEGEREKVRCWSVESLILVIDEW